MKNFKNLKKDFPIFKRRINDKKLVYLDSAATSQKPKTVISAISYYYENFNANIKRGIYPIAEEATKKVEIVRKKIAAFINARDPSEIIFVKNTTEGINLVANSLTSKDFMKGDLIVSTIMEHHSNFVPWQQFAKEKNLKFKVLNINENYQFSIRQLMDDFQSSIELKKAKLLAISHVSNVLGTINPLKEIIKNVKKQNPQIKILVDGAQSVPHLKVDVQDLDCDYLAFSGHKMLAATGIGVLYGKKELLEKMRPFLYGGGMVKEVDIKNTLFADLPSKFEAGTPNISGIISLGAAIDYLKKVGMENIKKYESELTVYCLEQMKKIEGLIIYGPKDINCQAGIISFNIKGIHSHDVAQILADSGICVRGGHHCAMPLHSQLGISSSIRVSFYLYNNKKDIDRLIEGIKRVKKIFKI